MKSLRSISRKREKAKVRRKSYLWRKHIKENAPKRTIEKHVEKYRSVHEEVVETKKCPDRGKLVKKVVYETDGITPKLEHVRTKVVIAKYRRARDYASMVPKPRKYKAPNPNSKTSIRRNEWAKRKEQLLKS